MTQKGVVRLPALLIQQVVLAVLRVLLIVSAVTPWMWNRPAGFRSTVGRRVVISIVATVIVAYTCLWTMADASTTSASGERVLCGGGYIGMLDSQVERIYGYPHECVLHSRIAIIVIILIIIAIILLEVLALRRFIRRPHHDSATTG